MKKLLIVTGELSGFNYVKELVPLLREKFKIYGVFLERIEGTELIFNSKEIVSFGLFESLRKLPYLIKAKRKIEKVLKEERIEAVLLVDFPGFNLQVAEVAKNLGKKVLYFISPKFWAWGEKRVYKFKKLVDKVFVIFPFEVSFYKKYSVPTVYVGNPLVDLVKPSRKKEEFLEKFNLREPLIALLPGSRETEVNYLLEPILKASLKFKEYQFALPVASSVKKEKVEKLVKKINPKVKLLPEEERYNLLFHAEGGVIASGTASLESAIAGLPHVVLYKLNPLTYFVAKRVVKIPFVSLPNIVAGEEVIPELLQEKVSPKNIEVHLREILRRKGEVKKLLLEKVRNKFKGNAIEKLAEEIERELS